MQAGLLEQEIHKHGDACRILPVGRLEDLKKDIEEFRKYENLNPFQKYITSSLYRFELPVANFTVHSIILIASPVPAYTTVVFNWQGKKIPVISLARAFAGKKDAITATGQYLSKFLKPAGYRIKFAPYLPLKRLAVCSGLAVYGRNNICYVDGMGSFLTFVAYFSDIPYNTDRLQEIRCLDACGNCSICINSCPTGAIRKERFLINNERCLSYLNESPGDFPGWLPVTVHHCLYDCLMCQRTCPQNKDYINHITGPIEFDEAETGLLLSGKTMKDFPPALRKKAKFLGINSWLKAIPRNVQVLFEKKAQEDNCGPAGKG